MDEMTVISINKYMYVIEVDNYKFEIISQNMQEKISDICLRFGSEYPNLGNPPIPMGGVPLKMDMFKLNQLEVFQHFLFFY
jgi:hypothetical protein